MALKISGRSRQVVYGLTSLIHEEASPKKLLALNRRYGGIDDSLHYRRDVPLHEDAARLTVGSTGHNMAILNNLIITLCNKACLDNLAKARRLLAAQSPTISGSRFDCLDLISFLVKALTFACKQLSTSSTIVVK